jgi:hypothetical protein
MTALNVLTVACTIASGVTAVVYLVGVYTWLFAGAALQRLGTSSCVQSRGLW